MPVTMSRDAELIVRLHELRAQEPYRSASRWLEREFRIGSWAELEERHPRGSDGFAALRTVLQHWDLVGGLVLSGQLDAGLLFDTTGEHLSVWETLGGVVIDARVQLGDPQMFENVELLVKSHVAWAQRTPPKRARNARAEIGESS